MIGYPSGQDGAILPARDYPPCPARKFPQKPYNKSFIPSLFGQDGFILASFFFCVFMDLDSVLVHKHAKKELGQYPAILTSHLVNNPYVLLSFHRITTVVDTMLETKQTKLPLVQKISTTWYSSLLCNNYNFISSRH